MSDQFLGEIRMVGFNFAPEGWAMCNGQLLPISQNTALFSLLGTFYGGDGVTTFALPNLQTRVPIHVGNDYVLGQAGGSTTMELNVNNLPAHTHAVEVGGAQTSNDPSGALLAQNGAYTSGPTTGTAASSFVGSTGGNEPFEVEQPYLVVNFVIALEGIYPSRS